SLQVLVDYLPARLAEYSDSAAAEKRPEAWSKKQELGHLIDSAANNHQRIVRAQMESPLALPGYDGDQWVDLHGYYQRDWIDLIHLGRGLTSQLLSAARWVPDNAWAHILTVGDSEPMTLGFVTMDYVRHMSDHLRYIGVNLNDLLNPPDGIYPEKPAPVSQP